MSFRKRSPKETTEPVATPVVPEQSEAVQRLQRWSSRMPASSSVTPKPIEPAPALEPELVPDAPVVLAAAPEPEPVSDTDAVSDTPSAPEKKPLLKRELSFKRAAKAPKPPKAKKEKQPKPAKQPKPPKAKKEKAPKEPRAGLKKELRLPKVSLAAFALPKPSFALPAVGRAKKAGDHKITDVVGLRIGSTQLAAAYVQNNGAHELVQLARTPLDRGLVAAGEVRDAEALSAALKAFFAQHKLPRKDVRLGIASNRIGVRVLDVPVVDDPKAFDNAIRFRAQELLPIPVTDAILDHVVLGEAPNDEGDVVRRVLLVFAHRELVGRYVDVCKDAGVRLSGIDLDAFALLRAVNGVQDAVDPDKAIVAVAIGAERTVLAVSDGKTCDYARVIEWGGSSLDVTIARALNLTPSQAEPVKQLLDLESEVAPEGLSPVQFEAVKAAVKTEIGALGRELVSSLRFYQSRPDSLALAQVQLTGGAAQLRGLPEELSSLLGIPMEVADPFAHVTLGKKVSLPPQHGSLAIAVGLGIEG